MEGIVANQGNFTLSAGRQILQMFEELEMEASRRKASNPGEEGGSHAQGSLACSQGSQYSSTQLRIKALRSATGIALEVRACCVWPEITSASVRIRQLLAVLLPCSESS